MVPTNKSSIIKDDSFENARPIDDIIVDEVGYSSLGSSVEGYFLNPLGMAFSLRYDPYVAPERWVNMTTRLKA